jgi:hypothetical protein
MAAFTTILCEHEFLRLSAIATRRFWSCRLRRKPLLRFLQTAKSGRECYIGSIV